MNQEDVRVSFYLKKSEADEQGECPIMGRLNVGKYSEAAFSVKMTAPESAWLSGRATGKSARSSVRGFAVLLVFELEFFFVLFCVLFEEGIPSVDLVERLVEQILLALTIDTVMFRNLVLVSYLYA